MARINQCAICIDWRTARDVPSRGADPGEIPEAFYEAVGVRGDWSGLSEREQLAAEFAERYSTDHLGMDEAFWDRLHAAYSDDELVDLALCVGSWLALGRFNQVFDIDGACRVPLRPAPRADPEPTGADRGEGDQPAVGRRRPRRRGRPARPPAGRDRAPAAGLGGAGTVGQRPRRGRRAGPLPGPTAGGGGAPCGPGVGVAGQLRASGRGGGGRGRARPPLGVVPGGRVALRRLRDHPLRRAPPLARRRPVARRPHRGPHPPARGPRLPRVDHPLARHPVAGVGRAPAPDPLRAQRGGPLADRGSSRDRAASSRRAGRPPPMWPTPCCSSTPPPPRSSTPTWPG